MSVIEIIGLATIVAMSWVLAFSMANESDADRRRRRMPDDMPKAGQGEIKGSAGRHAA
ncbi:MAG: hypothetical protein ACREJU_12355 [Nitrospiraceae bacterium]